MCHCVCMCINVIANVVCVHACKRVCTHDCMCVLWRGTCMCVLCKWRLSVKSIHTAIKAYMPVYQYRCPILLCTDATTVTPPLPASSLSPLVKISGRHCLEVWNIAT